MTERDECVCTIYKNKDTGEITCVAELKFLQTEFGSNLRSLLRANHKERLETIKNVLDVVKM